MNRYQSITIRQTSEWLKIQGTVWQGTLLGALCFLYMINDLSTECQAIKYVADATVHLTTQWIQYSPSYVCRHNHQMAQTNNMKAKQKTCWLALPRKSLKCLTSQLMMCPSVMSQNVKVHVLGVKPNNKLSLHSHVDKMIRKQVPGSILSCSWKRHKFLPQILWKFL